MKKVLALILSMLLLAAPMALADAQSAGETAKAAADQLPADARVVNVYTWSYYIPDEVVLNFEEATGMRVNYTPFSSNEEMLAKMQATSGQFDLIVCSDYIISTMAEQSLLTEIDPAKLANYGNIDAGYQSQFYDPDNKYSIPYTNTIPLIVYDPEAVDFEVTGYADLWNEAFGNNLAVIDDMRNIIGMAQKKLGYSYNETDPEKMALVKEELMALKDNIAVFNADTPHNALIGGDAIAGFMFGSQLVAAQLEMPQLQGVFPAEGLGFGIDSLVIPVNAPHLEATYIFLDYLLDGEVSAYASELINYGNCNNAARPYMSEAYLSNISVNAPADQVADAEMIRPLDDETLKLYDEIWSEFKK